MFVSYFDRTLIQYAMISTNNLTFKYRKQEHLFEDLTFEQKNGNIAGLLGKNGAGKSTLLKLIAGLLSPGQGEIEVNGFTPFKRNPDFLTETFFVPEEIYLPSTTIRNYTKALAPLYSNFDSNKMKQILQKFELNENYKLNKISYGQRKKVLIALALATNCKLLLLDEPTNGLDIPSKSIFRKVLVNSVDDNQLVIISTHQVKDIEAIIDKIIILEDGEIVFQKDSSSISKKLQFKTLVTLSKITEPIYYEKCPGGYKTILPTINNEETEIDIELLFNAIINKTEITL